MLRASRNIFYSGLPAALILLSPLYAKAQTAPALANPEAELADRGPLRSHELTLGDIRAEIATPAEDIPLAAGSSAFASVTVSSSARASANVEIALKAENSVIKAILQPNGRVSDGGGDALVELKGVRSGRERTVLAEIALPSQNGGGQAHALTVTLRKAGSSGDDGKEGSSLRIAWKVADCSEAFQSALTTAAGERLSSVKDALSALRAGRRDERSAWIFRPDLRKMGHRRGCRRKVREYDDDLGRWVRRCPKTAQKDGPITKDERSLILEAQTYLRNGGRDPNLNRKSSIGWAAFKAASNLENYLKQPANPAICTGAVKFSGYYIEKLEPLHKRVRRVTSLAQAANGIIEKRLTVLRQAAANLSGGHPAWGGATLALARPASGLAGNLKAAAVEVARLSGMPEQAIRDAESASSAREALRASSSAWKERSVTDEAYEKQLGFAFSLIEAAAIVKEAAAKYEALDRDFLGSFRFVQEAHGKHCNCGAN